MSRWLSLALAAVVLCGGGVLAAEEGAEPGPVPARGPLGRLVRGVRDVILSPLEIPATIRRVAADGDAAYGVFAGGAEGIGNGLMRLVGGVVEIVSFPIPGDTLPLGNERRLGERASPPLRPPTDITRP